MRNRGRDQSVEIVFDGEVGYSDQRVGPPGPQSRPIERFTRGIPHARPAPGESPDEERENHGRERQERYHERKFTKLYS